MALMYAEDRTLSARIVGVERLRGCIREAERIT
jgi:hypothetical protein